MPSRVGCHVRIFAKNSFGLSTITGHGCVELEGHHWKNQLKNTAAIADIMAPGDVRRLYQVVSQRAQMNGLLSRPTHTGSIASGWIGFMQVLPQRSMQVWDECKFQHASTGSENTGGKKGKGKGKSKKGEPNARKGFKKM